MRCEGKSRRRMTWCTGSVGQLVEDDVVAGGRRNRVRSRGGNGVGLVSDLGSGEVGIGGPPATLNSAVEEGYPWVGGERKSPVYQCMSLNLAALEGHPWVELEGGTNSWCSAQLSPV